MSTYRKYRNISQSILFSGNRTAYYVIWVKFLKVVMAPLDWLLSRCERVFQPATMEDPPVVFVVGLQRTGSTLVSQVMTNAFSFAQIGNFSSIFWRSRYLIHRISSRLFNISPPIKDFSSYYGISRGLFTVGDCYEVWDQWFGTDHYTVKRPVDKKVKEDLGDYFKRLYQAYRRPIMGKNNRNTLLIDVFREVFPKAYFVVVKRDLGEVVRSTVRASYDFFGDPPLLWGLYPENKAYVADPREDIVKQAVKQCYYLDKDLEDAVSALPEGYCMEVDYEKFCREPRKYLDAMASEMTALFGQPVTTNGEIFFDPFEPSGRLKDPEMDARIQELLDELRESDKAAN